MPRFPKVADQRDVPPGTALVVESTHLTVAIFNVGGRFFALDNACLRCGRDIASGSISGSEVTCAGCGWKYDLASGRNVGVPKLRIDTFEVKTSGSKILIAHHFAGPQDDE